MATLFSIPHLPVVLKPAEPWSEDEFFEFCQHNQELRFERSACGDVVMMSPVESGSSERNQEISGQLWLWNRKTGSGRAFDSSAGFTLPDNSMRSPDTAWISKRHWDSLTEQERSRFARICPEFLVELRSPSDSFLALRRKMELWIANGAQLAWLIDPEARAVEVYRPGREPELLESPAEVHGEGPVDGFILRMEPVWGAGL